MVDVTTDGEETFSEGADGMEGWGGAFMNGFYEALNDAAQIIREQLYDATPKRTGETAEAWYVVAADRDEYFITNDNNEIITYLTEGTSAHFVAPVWAQALHWTDEGGEYFSAGHMVSGIVGIPIEEIALEAAEPELDMLWDQAEEQADETGEFE